MKSWYDFGDFDLVFQGHLIINVTILNNHKISRSELCLLTSGVFSTKFALIHCLETEKIS